MLIRQDKKTNWKYIAIVAVFALAAMGVVEYQYRQMMEEEIGMVEVKILKGRGKQKQIQFVEKDNLFFYQNKELGIEFWYPKHLKIQGNEIIWPSVRNPEHGEVKPIFKFEINSLDRVLEQIVNICAADGPNGSTYCAIPESSQVEIKTNKNYLSYASFYTQMVNEQSGRDNDHRKIIVKKDKVGPFIFVPLSLDNFYILFNPDTPFVEYPKEYEKDIGIIINTLKYTPQSYTGIGVELSFGVGSPRIKHVFDNGPADRAGIREGAYLRKINDKWISKMRSSELIDLIKGSVGTKVKLTINYPRSSEHVDIIVTRQIVTMDAISNIKEELKKITVYLWVDESLSDKAKTLLCGESEKTCLRDILLPDVDLHAYTEKGLHIGVNYETGEYENQVLHSYACGEGSGRFNECVSVFGKNKYKTRFVVDAYDIQKFFEKYPDLKNEFSSQNEGYKILLKYQTNWREYSSTSFERFISPDQKIIYNVSYSDNVPKLIQTEN